MGWFNHQLAMFQPWFKSQISVKKLVGWTAIYSLGGGFKHVLCSPRNLGKIPIFDSYLSRGVDTNWAIYSPWAIVLQSRQRPIVSWTLYRTRCFMFDLKGADCWTTTFSPWNFDPPQKKMAKKPPWNQAAKKPLHLKNGCWNAWKMKLLMKCLFGASST